MVQQFEDERKPLKKRRATRGRFSHHTCFHHDWWTGCVGLPLEQVGLYERIIKLMYIRRAALKDDFRELAQLCHCELRTFKRVFAALIERGRLVYDEENGLIYDERTIRELVDSGFFSEEQTRRAVKRHSKTPALTLVDERFRADTSNVVPLNDDAAVSVAQVLAKVGTKVATKLGDNSPPSEEKQSLGSELGHANHYPIPIARPENPKKPETVSPGPLRRSPPKGGGAPPEPRHGMTPEQWRADQLQRMGLGNGDGETEPDKPTKPKRKHHSKAADRRARRA